MSLWNVDAMLFLNWLGAESEAKVLNVFLIQTNPKLFLQYIEHITMDAETTPTSFIGKFPTFASKVSLAHAARLPGDFIHPTVETSFTCWNKDRG